MVRVMDIFEAIENGEWVIAPDGSECIVLKMKKGKAKVRRITERGDIQEAWIPVYKLNVKK